MNEPSSGASGGDAVNPMQFLLSHPVGHVQPLRLDEPLEGCRTVVAAHEDREHVRLLGEEPDMEASSALYPEGDVGVVVLLLRIQCLSTVYEMWLNYHNAYGRGCMEDLARQDKFFILFFMESTTPARTIWYPTPVRAAMAEYIERLETQPSWSMSDFDTAKAALQARYESPSALWEGLREVREAT